MISTPIQPRPCKRRGPDCCAACCCPTAAGTAFTPYEHEPLCVECWHKLSRLERARIFLLAWTLAPIPREALPDVEPGRVLEGGNG